MSDTATVALISGGLAILSSGLTIFANSRVREREQQLEWSREDKHIDARLAAQRRKEALDAYVRILSTSNKALRCIDEALHRSEAARSGLEERVDALIGTFNETVELVNLTQDEQVAEAARTLKDAMAHMISTYNGYEESGINDDFAEWHVALRRFVGARDDFYSATRPRLDELSRQAALQSLALVAAP